MSEKPSCQSTRSRVKSSAIALQLPFSQRSYRSSYEIRSTAVVAVSAIRALLSGKAWLLWEISRCCCGLGYGRPRRARSFRAEVLTAETWLAGQSLRAGARHHL